ncbi:MFS transporter [Deinococcus sp. HMF7604]|uniref:MFS transporter n=1 Tax=Deinococcus betulae TaxID=2873312 RepID=UPI001CCCE605|nr:MFS transporter [Deinococcus betulae]MBZ9752572.1 MFS transporter [Deinococcus betulae]
MLWQRPLTMLRLLALLALSETVRAAFFVAALPIGGPALGLSAAVIGVMAGAHYLADALMRGPAGALVARAGLGPTLLAGSVLGLLTLWLTRTLPSPLGGVLACAVWGAGSAALWPAVMSASQALARPERTARALTVTNLTAVPAVLVGALAAGPLMQGWPEAVWTGLLLLQGAAAALALSLWRTSLPLRTAPAPWREWRGVAALLPTAFVQTLAPGLLVTTLYPMLSFLGLRLGDLLLPGALTGVLIGVSAAWLGRHADRDHPGRALLPGLALLSAGFFLAALTGAQFLWLLAAVAGVGFGAFLTGWNGLVARTLPQGQRAAAWGAVMTAEALGAAAGPMLGGAAWQVWGVGGVFALGGAAFAGALLYAVRRPAGKVAAS